MKTTTRTTLTTVLAAAVTVLALAGCSTPSTSTTPSSSATATPTPTATLEGQSKGDACTLILNAVKTVGSELAGSMSEMQTDPATTVTKVNEQADKFHASMVQVTYEPLVAQTEATDAAFRSFADQIEATAKDSSNSTVLMDSVTSLQASFTAVTKSCV